MSVKAESTVGAIFRTQQTGFGVIELMVVVALLAVFTAMALPGFSNLTRSNQALTASNEIYSVLQYARSEAMSRGRGVTVSVDSASAWAGDIYVKAGTQTLRHAAKGNVSNVTATSTLATLTFCPGGFIAATSCSSGVLSSPPTIVVGYANDSSITTRSIQVLASGQISRPTASQ